MHFKILGESGPIIVFVDGEIHPTAHQIPPYEHCDLILGDLPPLELTQAFLNLCVTTSGEIYARNEVSWQLVGHTNPTSRLIIGDQGAYNSDIFPLVIQKNAEWELVDTRPPSGTIKFMGENALVYSDNSIWVLQGRNWVLEKAPSETEVPQAHSDACDGLIYLSGDRLYDEEGCVASGVQQLLSSYSYVDRNGALFAREAFGDFFEIGQFAD